MLRLHGFAVSNYFNMVRMALEAKGIEHEIAQRFPSQSDDWLALSPMGKVPVLETPEGPIAETIVILEYLDEAFPETPLLPQRPYARARVRQMMHTLKLHLELPARRLFPGVFFGAHNPEWAVEEVRPVLEKGVRAVRALSDINPYLMGAEPTAADYMAMYILDLASVVADKVYQWDLLADIPGSAGLLEQLNANPAATRIALDKAAEMEAFIKLRSQG